MFGQQNDITARDQNADINVTLPDNAIAALANDPAVGSATDSPAPPVSAPAIDDTALPGATPEETPLPGAAPESDPATSDFLSPVVSTENPLLDNTPTPETPTQPAPSDAPESALVTPGDQPLPQNLLNIKQEALEALSPLVGQLDLGPEDKFRTLMMLIQASDNRDLVPEAYDAAKQISDEKARAQALLDIVNEINYFTRN